MKKLFHLLSLLIFFNLYSQNIQTEFFVNENQIEESFKSNSRIENYLHKTVKILFW
jgi:hypothetical protein